MRRFLRAAAALGLIALAAASFLPAQTRTSGSSRGPAAPLNGLDQFVTSVMETWHVPGLALGVVKGGKVVLAKGYGYRDVEQKLPVTSRTIMAIGSNSKSFTAVLMGMLVDEKKLDWDKPVRIWLPDFQLWDPFATRDMTPKDLITHRSGLPRHDALWYGRSFSRQQLYERLRYLEPSASFRSRYQYQNLMFMTAGYLTERITGRSWEEQIRERIFIPLGMTRSNTSVAESPRSDDFAYPYGWRDSALVRLPFRNIDAVGPAGSINSSVDDMLKYIQFRLNQGSADGRQLLSRENERLMQSPQMISGGESDSPELGVGTYGLGVGVSTYRGHKVVSHGGGIDGFISAMSWLPADSLGVIVLTNFGGNNPVPTIVARNVYDRFLGLDQVDWVGRTKRQQDEGRVRQERQRREREAERTPGTSPSHALAAFAGTYEHPGYGRVVIRTGGPGLEMVLDGVVAGLSHFHYDIFELADPGGAVPFQGRMAFLTNKKGEVDRVAIPLEPNVSDIVFTRVNP